MLGAYAERDGEGYELDVRTVVRYFTGYGSMLSRSQWAHGTLMGNMGNAMAGVSGADVRLLDVEADANKVRHGKLEWSDRGSFSRLWME